MIHFKIVPHIVLEVDIVEIWIDDRMVGALYPQAPNSVRLITNHPDGGPYIETVGLEGLPVIVRQDFDVTFTVHEKLQ